jgi:hypothetical protein
MLQIFTKNRELLKFSESFDKLILCRYVLYYFVNYCWKSFFWHNLFHTNFCFFMAF